MTVLDTKNQLFNHFLSKDVFDFSKDSLDLGFTKELVGHREPLVRVALEDFEKSGFVKKLVSDDTGKEIWILSKPISEQVQKVEISSITAMIIGDVVNIYNEQQNIPYRCDKAQIGEQDILRVLQIFDTLEDSEEEKK